MKAAVINRFGPPEVFELVEIEKPIPNPDEIVIQMKASSINPVDWKTRMGNLKYILGSNFPIILGYDAAGIVHEVGANVRKFKPGDKVYGRLDKKFGGALAEYAVGNESVFAFIPEQLTFEEAAAIPLAALTALQGLRDLGKIKLNQKILIVGATGGVGHFAVQVAKKYQSVITGVCGPGHVQMLDFLGMDGVINYAEADFLKIDDRFDCIFDAAGMTTLPRSYHLLKPKGVFVTTLPRPRYLYDVIFAFFTGRKVKTFLMKPLGSDLEIINQWVEDQSFKPVIDTVFPLENIASAHKMAELYHSEGKIIISIGD